jgi:hypothetical protein
MITKTRVFGSDPEFALYVESKEYKSLSIPKLVPPAALITDYGVKFTENKNKKKVLMNVDGTQVIEDGAAIEINLKPMNLGRGGEFVGKITSILNAFENYVNQVVGNDYWHRVAKEPLGYFDLDNYWKGRGEEFQMCVIFGCDPDVYPETYNAMGLEEANNKIVDVSTHDLRYFGGHLHIQNMSNDSDIYLQQQEFAPVVLDFTVGALNAAFLRRKDQRDMELERLKYYGRPGRVRFQVYDENTNGIEYRPLSNYWVRDSMKFTAITRVANIAASLIEDGLARDFFIDFRDDIPGMWEALTTLDADKAKRLLNKSLAWMIDEGYIMLSEASSFIQSLGTIT